MAQDVSIEQRTRHFTELWWQCADTEPSFGRAYTTHEQSEREKLLAELLDNVGRIVKQPMGTPQQRQESQQTLTMMGALFAKTVFGFENAHLEAVQSCGITEATAEFARQARRFDTTVSSEDIFQAARNVMSMNLMQLAMGLPVQVTPSVFAYSMLYPYSDNYLDDPSIKPEVKRAFNERFRLRLMGDTFEPRNAYEQKINTLIGMIEGQYDRVEYPLVHKSLFDIFVAQARSMRLHQHARSPYEVDVLGLSFEKGGAAVVADAYLVAGRPTERQLEVAFGYGAFTQLMDDLEDVKRDHADGILTVFSQTAGSWPLDGVTSKLFNMAYWVLDRLPELGTHTPEPLQEVMRRFIHLLLADSAGSVAELYTKPYIAHLEQYMPFRFNMLRKQRQRLNRLRASLIKFIELSDWNGQLASMPFMVKSQAVA
jgi:hypothetical protein